MEIKLRLIIFLDKFFPVCGRLKRFAYACWAACTPARRTYSQYGEDAVIVRELQGWSPSDSIFVDVGANQPAQISNSYLLYRKGWHGITVEPNAELVKLHRLFRRRDVQVNVGCGREASLLQFYVSRMSVLSSFSKQEVEHVSRLEYLPILTVDQILAPFQDKKIALLSVDTEGFDLEVLQGAKETLKRAFLVCVEANSEEERSKIEALLADDFERCVATGCNVIFRSRSGKQKK